MNIKIILTDDFTSQLLPNNFWYKLSVRTNQIGLYHSRTKGTTGTAHLIDTISVDLINSDLPFKKLVIDNIQNHWETFINNFINGNEK
jgi:hypothetical protein